ncbi:hypothetical protein KNP414_02427 [Paenibacillus mucilaginosus KNP414]|uniref:Uncharacterized protein n=1 Tax=Paenibacillus mucilaginosus (strain KNP414) TaxID=1036673 RepID=F8F803_PAEMK|nr:hypothetical protein KNP414_02427 [Paenibacillus mucilaginosus KNP414]
MLRAVIGDVIGSVLEWHGIIPNLWNSRLYDRFYEIHR